MTPSRTLYQIEESVCDHVQEDDTGPNPGNKKPSPASPPPNTPCRPAFLPPPGRAPPAPRRPLRLGAQPEGRLLPFQNTIIIGTPGITTTAGAAGAPPAGQRSAPRARPRTAASAGTRDPQARPGAHPGHYGVLGTPRPAPGAHPGHYGVLRTPRLAPEPNLALTRSSGPPRPPQEPTLATTGSSRPQARPRAHPGHYGVLGTPRPAPGAHPGHYGVLRTPRLAPEPTLALTRSSGPPRPSQEPTLATTGSSRPQARPGAHPGPYEVLGTPPQAAPGAHPDHYGVLETPDPPQEHTLTTTGSSRPQSAPGAHPDHYGVLETPGPPRSLPWTLRGPPDPQASPEAHPGPYEVLGTPGPPWPSRRPRDPQTRPRAHACPHEVLGAHRGPHTTARPRTPRAPEAHSALRRPEARRRYPPEAEACRPQGRGNARRPPDHRPQTRGASHPAPKAARLGGGSAAGRGRGPCSPRPRFPGRAARAGRQRRHGIRLRLVRGGQWRARPGRAQARAGPRRSRGRYCGGVWPRARRRRLPGWGPRSIALGRGRPLAPGPSGGCGGRRPHETLPPIGPPYPPPPLARPAGRQGLCTSRRRGGSALLG
ncbi:basic proline-rich protein-like [Sciurus carolinensis]|uniref:basic proline-rich protein-like n=1 Tax=Sciurus carolinensis TaxID=30640 RepID=UPI001FB23E0F|nr:basic proline-rich protein-like [Sciurus carolinensis]